MPFAIAHLRILGAAAAADALEDAHSRVLLRYRLRQIKRSKYCPMPEMLAVPTTFPLS